MHHPTESPAAPPQASDERPDPSGRPYRLPDTGTGDRWVFGFPGQARAEVHTLGARLHSLLLPDRRGRFADVVLAGTDAPTVRGPASYFGATVGRYANRIAGGRLVVDGVVRQLDTQDTGHSLHGGPDGFDRRVWRAEPVHSADRTGVRLFLLSPDGDQGFPGALSVRLTCTLDRDNALTFDYHAVSDAPTVVNLTNHTYWNLEGEGSGDVLGHELQIHASRWTPVDAALIPSGPHRPVEGTPFDLRQPRPLSAVFAEEDEQLRLGGGGFDHNWVLGKTPSALPRSAAVLHAPASGRRLELHTSEPGLQVYTGNLLAGEITGKSGRAYGRHAGVALETQHFPDSPNRTDDPSTLVRPGEVYHSRTVLRFSVTEE